MTSFFEQVHTAANGTKSKCYKDALAMYEVVTIDYLDMLGSVVERVKIVVFTATLIG